MGETNGKCPTYAIYPLAVPGGDAGEDLTPALRQALRAHRERYGDPPTGLVVSKPQEGKAQEALKLLGIKALQVMGNGGCLSWECWLAVERPASLLSGAQLAQGETAPAGAGETLADTEQPSHGLEVTQ